MAYSLDNFVRSTLSADATASDTTLTIAAAAAPLRDPPDASPASPGVLILIDQPGSAAKIEVVTYTGRSISGNDVTLSGVQRGCEGTSATSWTAGTPVYTGITAAVVADLQAALDDKLDADANAVSASKLKTARTIALGGLLGGSASFDGSGNVTITATMADAALSIAKVSGLQAALDAKATGAQGALAESAVQPNTEPHFPAVFVQSGGQYARIFYKSNNTDAYRRYFELKINGADGVGRFSLNKSDANGAYNGYVFTIDNVTNKFTVAGAIGARNLSGTNTGDQTWSTLPGKPDIEFGTVGNSLVLRNSAGDVRVRLVQAEYPDQSNMGGGLVFRINNTDNAYLRTCNSPASIRGWLGLGSAATTASNSYATAAQGDKANTAVQPGDLSPYAKLSGANFTGAVTAPSVVDTSDRRLKTNIRRDPQRYRGIRHAIEMVLYDRIKGTSDEPGVLAQEVRDAGCHADDFVGETSDGTLTVHYGKLALACALDPESLT